jgi:hypothetical protein
MAFKEAHRIGFGAVPFSVQDLMVICEMDQVLITQVLPVDDMEVICEMDNVTLAVAAGGAKPTMLLVF